MTARAGGRIEGAGIFPHVDIDHYLGDIAPGPSISASGLARILDCPARYWAESYMNPLRTPRTTKALDFGRSAHAWVLGEPEWHTAFVVAPYDDFRSKEARAWRDAEKRTIVRPAEFETIKAMAAAIKSTAQTANAFMDAEGRAEVSIVWQDAETGIWLKARPDWLPDHPETAFIREYKTAATIEPRRLSNDAFRYCYDCQAAMIWDGLAEVGTNGPPLGIAHIVQEKDPPYLCDLRMFSVEQLDAGRTRYRHALKIFARCLDRGEWPAYTTEPQFFETPSWLMKQVVELDENEPADHYRTNGFGEVLAAV